MAKAKEKSLEDILKQCRDALRGVGSNDKNRDAVISLVFLKFAGDKFEKRREEIIEEHGDNLTFLEKPSFYNAKNVFYLNETSRWSYITQNASSNSIANILDNALSDIEKNNKQLSGALQKNLFSTLDASNSKIKSLIDSVNEINDSRFHEEDLIGRVYEYFLKIYSASGTKDDGEFYTPACVVKTIAELIEPYEGVVYDPCCGTGGMFVQSMKFVEHHHGNKKMVSIIGQESKKDTWKLCKMNLASRGIAHNLGDKNASTFENDLHKGEKVDYIMANPPFNLKPWLTEQEIQKDSRFKGYALPPDSNANYGWILHMISKLDVNHGIAGFLLSNGALNAEGSEGEIRKALIEKDYIEAIIVLPRDMFYTVDLSCTLWIINMNKKEGTVEGRKVRNREKEILFVDLRTWNQNIEKIEVDKGQNKKKVYFTDEQIIKIKELFNNWQSPNGVYENIPELCYSASLEEIREEKYSLAPSKYIEFIDHDIEIDYETEMKRIQQEMKEIIINEKESQNMLVNAFEGIGYGIE